MEWKKHGVHRRFGIIIQDAAAWHSQYENIEVARACHQIHSCNLHALVRNYYHSKFCKSNFMCCYHSGNL